MRAWLLQQIELVGVISTLNYPTLSLRDKGRAQIKAAVVANSIAVV
jgi:hypothetical protein